MKVKIIQTGEMKEFHDSYALRLIEQGKAVPVQSASEHRKETKGAGVK